MVYGSSESTVQNSMEELWSIAACLTWLIHENVLDNTLQIQFIIRGMKCQLVPFDWIF